MVNLSSLWSQCHHPSPDPLLSHLDTSTSSPLFLTPPIQSPLSERQFLQYKSDHTMQIWLFLAPKFSMTSPYPQHWDLAPSGSLTPIISPASSPAVLSQFLTSNCIWPLSVLQTSCSHPPLKLHTLYSVCELTCPLFTCLSALSILSVKTLLDHSPLRTDPLPHASVLCNTPA